MRNRFPKVKTRAEWRGLLDTLNRSGFTHIPAVLLHKSIQTCFSPGVDLKLITSTHFVLYNAHRCLCQLSLPRHVLPRLSHATPIKPRVIGTPDDEEEARSIAAIWKTSLLRVLQFETLEDEDLKCSYISKLRALIE